MVTRGTFLGPTSDHRRAFVKFGSNSPAWLIKLFRPFAVHAKLAIPRNAKRVFVSRGLVACQGEDQSQTSKNAIGEIVPMAGETAAKYRARSITSS